VTGLPRFILLYAAMYAAYGVASPFLPAFAAGRGLGAGELGIVLAAATLVRFVVAPLAGRAGDALRTLKLVLFACIALGAGATLAYLHVHGFWAFLLVALLQAAALAPVTVLADALAIRRRFEYGWVRGGGSAAFIGGTLVSGQLVTSSGLDAIVGSQAALLVAAAGAALLVPEIAHERAPKRRLAEGLAVLVLLPAYRGLMIVAALVLGSHAMHDSFAVIRWSAAGISPALASLLWSEAVAAEVLVFVLIGPPLIRKIGPASSLLVAASAAIVRWIVMASTADLAALAAVQPLHGLTFALLHLAAMRIIVREVPAGLEGVGQAVYGLGIGATSALVTLAAGGLYARFGAPGFWAMAGLCAAALLPAWRLRRTSRDALAGLSP